MRKEFLPLTGAEAKEKGWNEVDFVVVTGDAYVDHPSFGAAIISRLTEALGFRVGVLAQPDFSTCESFREFGKPKYAFLIGGGNVDSMVAHYTVAKRRRTMDEYTPGGVLGKRPDRAASVYAHLAKQAYPDVPVVLGGLEASLRRFAHYDYWEDTVLPSILETSGADLLTFGMGERQTAEICQRLAAGEAVETLHNIAGTCYLAETPAGLPDAYVECAGFSKVSADKSAYARACRFQMDHQDCVTAKPVAQKQKNSYVVQNPPARPLGRMELDKVFALPFTRRWHPSYDAMGGVPGLEEVEFSIMQNRGCFGGCNFCAITMHQGRRVTSRSKESILREAEAMTHAPGFKGYIHDVGGPTANFRYPSCAGQMKKGMCTDKKCLAPGPCPALIIDHTEYLDILRAVRGLPGIKKVFIRSGIRYDYLIWDKNDAFFRELVTHHVSGQLKVAPEHCAPNTLRYMGKPPVEVFNKFCDKFYALTKQAKKKQYLIPYLMSSHPGSTLKDAVLLAEYLWKHGMKPEQVQDFYPTPGTVSTCMFYTGLDPYTMQPVHVVKDPEEKAMQRALLQYYEPKNRERVLRALRLTNREDLIPKLAPGAATVKKDKGVQLWQPPQGRKQQGARAGKRGGQTGAKRR